MQDTREKENDEVYLDPIIRIKRIRSEEEPVALETFSAKGHPSKRTVMTSGIRETFGDLAPTIASIIVHGVQTEVLTKGPLDYHQTFEVTAEGKTAKLWLIDDGEVVTLLLPDEY
ncbi:MAG: hypothetical protein HYT79_11405 [Elusimicrobia bacterium]|nr:hypothetical protein [Elusimicrobiota bacterium]